MAEYDTPQTKEGAPDKRFKSNKDLWEQAKRRWAYVNEQDSENRAQAKQDEEFVWVRGKQWPDAERIARESSQRPWLEINQMPQFVNMVVNDQREQRPGIKIRPADDAATPETAKVIEGHIRDIEYQSKAPAVYDDGYTHSVTSGRGYWRVITEYESEKSFQQVLRIKRIPDLLSVRLDPDYQEPDASDIEWGFISEDITKEEFKRRWPKASPLDFEASDKDAIRDGWLKGDNVVIADYYTKVYSKRTLVQFDNGQTAWKDEITADPPEEGRAPPVEGEKPVDTYGGARIVQEREVEDCEVKWFKCYGGGFLESYDWAGKYVPIVMDIGVETMIDGKRTYQGLIRRARDIQKMYNFWETKATEWLALAPNAQWLTPEGSVDGYEHIWDTANLRYMTRLPYNAAADRPPPTRVDPPPVQAGVLEQANQCRQDFYSVIGIYPPNLAQESKTATSGVALNSRLTAGDRQTFHFADNHARAIAHTGRILVDLIPKIIDTPRNINTISQDGKQSVEQVNQPNPVDVGATENDLRKGEYAVVVDVGPGYATKRQESAEQMLAFINAFPAAAPMLGDLLARAQDWEDADKIAARLNIMLPPAIQMLEAQGSKDPQVQALLGQLQQLQGQLQGTQQQMGGQIQFLTQELQKANTKLLQAQASGATSKLQGAKQALSAALGQHNAEVRAAAEHERTGIEQQDADTKRLDVVLDFILGLVEAQQKQQQNAAQEANQFAAETRGMTS